MNISKKGSPERERQLAHKHKVGKARRTLAAKRETAYEGKNTTGSKELLEYCRFPWIQHL